MKKYYSLPYSGLLVLLLFVFQNCSYSQNRNFNYRVVNQRSFASSISNNELQVGIASAAKAESYLPKNFSKLGRINYTDFLQKAINDNDIVLFPNFPIMIDYRGLNLRSNTTLIFQTGSKLIMQPNDKANYQALSLVNIQNVKIFGPKIVGDRDKHANVKGEWGHGIKIFGSKSIKIYDIDISNCWGDGIYVGKGVIPYSEDIKIDGGRIDNCRRNGISIVSCKNSTLKNIIVSNTNGTLPMAAVDLEPNAPDEELYNLNIENIKTINNGYSGILIALQQLRNKKVKIDINGHHDDGALYYPLNIYGILKGEVSSWGVGGDINYSNSYWSSSNYLQYVHEGGNLNKLLKLNLSNNYYNNRGVKQRLTKDKLNTSKVGVSFR